MNSKLIIILTAGISLLGCTTMRPIDTRKTDLAEQLEVGDHVIIYEKSGRIVDMTLALIDADTLRGSLTETTGIAVQVDINDIEKIEVERIAVGRTTAAVLGVIVLLPIVALGAGMAMSDH